MKRLIVIATLAASLPVLAADVGVSVTVSQPGVYGRIDIGRFPQPQVVVQQPVLVYHQPRHVQPPQPVYLWVPPGHQKNWSKHCGRYGACGVPVYFVRDDWYGQQIKPKGEGRQGYEWRDDRRDDRQDNDRDNRGNGNGNGKGHGNGR
jgi:hypothetical protein